MQCKSLVNDVKAHATYLAEESVLIFYAICCPLSSQFPYM